MAVNYSSKSKSDLILLINKRDDELMQKEEELTEMRIKNAVLEHKLEFESRIVELERRLAASEQYSRRECVEIVGIPKAVPDDQIEQKVIEILNTSGGNWIISVEN